MKKLNLIISAFYLIATIQVCAQKTYQPTWESINSRPIPTWFEDAKFGIFIHWGLYSVPSWAPTDKDISVYAKYAEWYWPRITGKVDPNPQKGDVNKIFTEHHNKIWGSNFKYQDFAPMFKAEEFNPDIWADIIKDAGAKYVVLTSKHHEGFTLWPSAQSSNWNSVDIGPHRDLCGDLTTSVKNKGLHMGFYYSLYEWFNPLYHSNPNKYAQEHMIPQMKDLVTRYQPDVLWTDGEWEHPSDVWGSTQFLSWLYNESSVKNSVVVNDRWGKETRGKHGGFYTTEYDLVGEESAKGNKFEHPWEECRGVGGSFGYNRNENLEDYSSSEELIHILIDKVARGGNLLLNVGPTSDGRIPVIMQQRLFDIGTWLKINGESIYGTRKWENAPKITDKTNLFFTKKDNKLYAITTEWSSKPIVVENVKNATNVKLIGYSGKVKFKVHGNKLIIYPPNITINCISGKYAWVYKVQNIN